MLQENFNKIKIIK